MKHKHYELAKAKIENMDLVLFIKPIDSPKWSESMNAYPPNNSNIESFLCLPQHKEACLHWLNGGDIQDCFNGEWTEVRNHSGNPVWNEPDQLFMNEEFQLRIAPKKEKRIIGIHKDGRTTSHYAIDDEGNYAIDEIRITGKGDPSDWQFIEIEIEVEV